METFKILRRKLFDDVYPNAPIKPPTIEEPLIRQMVDRIHEEEVIKGFRMAVRTTASRYFQDLLLHGEMDEILPAITQLRKHHKDVVGEKNYPWWHLTINVNYKVVPQEMALKKLHKFLEKAFIKQYVYTIEQRGETDEEIGKGLHFHILVEQNARDLSTFKTGVKNSFNKICDVSNREILCFKPKVDEQAFKDCYRYLHGIKVDEEKQQRIEIDKKFREKNDFQKIYKSSNFNFPDIPDLDAVLMK
jgi:uncharacterized protein YqgV (UPF0045/DUF77 family)